MKNVSKNLLWTLLGLVLFGVTALWAISSLSNFVSGPAGALISLGQLAGLLAAVGALLQFMLMGRIGWIEKPFGLDQLAIFHRLNGYATISLILIHPALLAIGYGLNAGISALSQYSTFITAFEDVWKALIAEILFLFVVASSIYIVRRKLAFEQWYWVHLSVYAAIILAFAHQIHVGGTFVSSSVSRNLWISLYAFVALNVLYYRFVKIALQFARFRFKVTEVVPETDATVSIYITGKNLKRWKSRAGQFVMVRFLTKDQWTQEHPFSLSMIPKDNRLRLTVKNVGDYTAQLQQLTIGAAVLISGPFGHFTADITANPKRLYIAGGVGITPIRTLMEEAGPSSDGVLLYANRTASDTVLLSELTTIAAPKRILTFYSDDPDTTGEHGRINIEAITRLVPDFLERDIFLCGPPPMMTAVIELLTKAKHSPGRLHYERFSLHQ